MMRKAQAAMEFLMTYGWAILVVLAAIGALAYFGVLSPDRFLPDKCTLQGGFSCVDFKIDGSNDQVRFRVINNLGVQATLANVTLATNDCTLVAGTFAVGPLDNREESALVFQCGANELSGSFNGDITVLYQRANDQETHTATGSITGDVEG